MQIIVGDEREYEQEDEQNEGVNRTKDENERDRTGWARKLVAAREGDAACWC